MLSFRDGTPCEPPYACLDAPLLIYFHRLTKIIGMVEKTDKWPLMSGSPLTRWTRGKLVILGDAAHAMLPYMSQGDYEGTIQNGSN